MSCYSLSDDEAVPMRVIRGLEGATDVRVGENHVCARTVSGEIACWGHLGWLGDGRGQASGVVDVAGIHDAAQLAAGSDTICVRRETGEIACWGANHSTPAPIEGIRDAVDLGVGYDHACVRRASGEVACGSPGSAPHAVPRLAGANPFVVTGRSACGLVGGKAHCEPAGSWPYGLAIPSDAKRIWATSDRSCAQLADGRTRCERQWGRQIDLGNDTVSVAFGLMGLCYVHAAGGVACRDRDEGSAREVRGITNATAIARVAADYCVLLGGGSVSCWIGNAPPAAIAGVTDAVELVGNDRVGCVRRRDGTVMCWGAYDGVGDGSHAQTEVPVVIPLRSRPDVPDRAL